MKNDTEKGDEFVRRLVLLAGELMIEPRHAIQCFGKVAALLTEFELRNGRVTDPEAGMDFLREQFDLGAASYKPKRH